MLWSLERALTVLSAGSAKAEHHARAEHPVQARGCCRRVVAAPLQSGKRLSQDTPVTQINNQYQVKHLKCLQPQLGKLITVLEYQISHPIQHKLYEYKITLDLYDNITEYQEVKNEKK